MKFRSTAVLAATLATAPAFASFISTATLTMTSGGTNDYAMPGNVWTVTFYTDADLSQSGADANFGNWILAISGSNGRTWQTSSSETFGGTYRNVTGARIFTVDLANAEGNPLPGMGDLTPIPGKLTMKFTTRRVGVMFEDMEDALLHSGTTTNASQRGSIVVTSADGASVISGNFSTVVPAPGAAALVGLAGLLVSRRRA